MLCSQPAIPQLVYKSARMQMMDLQASQIQTPNVQQLWYDQSPCSLRSYFLPSQNPNPPLLSCLHSDALQL